MASSTYRRCQEEVGDRILFRAGGCRAPGAGSTGGRGSQTDRLAQEVTSWAGNLDNRTTTQSSLGGNNTDAEDCGSKKKCVLLCTSTQTPPTFHSILQLSIDLDQSTVVYRGTGVKGCQHLS